MTDLCVISLYGRLENHNRAYVERELALIDRFEPGTLTVLDFGGVVSFDSTLVGELCAVRARLSESHRICLLSRRGNYVWHFFTVMHLNALFPIFDSSEAVHRFAYPGTPYVRPSSLEWLLGVSSV